MRKTLFMMFLVGSAAAVYRRCPSQDQEDGFCRTSPLDRSAERERASLC